jgi:hypothetical protein
VDIGGGRWQWRQGKKNSSKISRLSVAAVGVQWRGDGWQWMRGGGTVDRGEQRGHFGANLEVWLWILVVADGSGGKGRKKC